MDYRTYMFDRNSGELDEFLQQVAEDILAGAPLPRVDEVRKMLNRGETIERVKEQHDAFVQRQLRLVREGQLVNLSDLVLADEVIDLRKLQRSN